MLRKALGKQVAGATFVAFSVTRFWKLIRLTKNSIGADIISLNPGEAKRNANARIKMAQTTQNPEDS